MERTADYKLKKEMLLSGPKMGTASEQNEEKGFILGWSIVIPVNIILNSGNEEEEHHAIDHGAEGIKTEKHEGWQHEWDSTEAERKPCIDREESKEVSHCVSGAVVEDGDGCPFSAAEDVKPLALCVCQVTGDEWKLLQQHRQVHSKPPLRCGLCPCPGGGSQALKCHAATHVEKEALRCELCGSSLFATDPAEFVPVKPEDPVVKSKACETPLCVPAKSPHHKSGTGRGGAEYTCKECPYTTNSSYNLSCHARTHSGERPFQCPRCARCFRTRSTLNRHRRSRRCRDRGKPSLMPARLAQREKLTLWECGDCEYSTVNGYNFKVHQRIHSDERPYRCNRCESAFRTQSHLYRHERCHQRPASAPGFLGH
ncbi:zinc finger protein 878-like [Megalops cyprinoides]|uniref:zinc finger protein 878-like n=1 Tax=Megalops cyprinoides TaxID=118141 RepID=UPI001863F031|nr:zinc finger protein 878-like [Megalops cyprinoides]